MLKVFIPNCFSHPLVEIIFFGVLICWCLDWPQQNVDSCHTLGLLSKQQTAKYYKLSPGTLQEEVWSTSGEKSDK